MKRVKLKPTAAPRREPAAPVDAPTPQPRGATRNPVAPKTVMCVFCKHAYINPCDDKRKDTCMNWLWKSGKIKVSTPAAPKKPERVKLQPKVKGKRNG